MSLSPGLFERAFVSAIDMGRTWAVSRDGQRFLLQEGQRVLGRSSELMVVQNWFDELRRAAPTGKE